MADTPLMIQYREMKKQYSDMILFFRLGDFYEMFDEDAVEVSGLLNLTLTHKGESPMCGIPYHAAHNYIKRLLDSGKKIAICEQIELSAKGLAKREVVRIVTPATVVEDDFVDSFGFSWILSLFGYTYSYCDVTTGDFHLGEIRRENRVQSIRSLIEQLHPKEILVCEDEYFLDGNFKQAVDSSHAMVTKLPPWYFTVKTNAKLMCETAGVTSLNAYGLNENSKCIGPAGAVIRYVKETSRSSITHLTEFRLDSDDLYLSLDESSRKNLELFTSLSDSGSRYTLFDTINRTRTSSGNRLLKNWLSFPLRSIDLIRERQNWVRFFYENSDELKRVRGEIVNALDMNRLTTRVLMKKASPHDLLAVSQSIRSFLNIVVDDPERYSTLFEINLRQKDNLDDAVSLMELFESAVNPAFLGLFNPGEVILDGFDSILDEKRRLKGHSDEILQSYLEQEKEKTGLTILKLGYNRVFGYYLEVPKGQVSKVPEYFLRKQTLVNGERFTTTELQKYEISIMQASREAEERERVLYEGLLSKVVEHIAVLNSIGHFMSLLDVYQSLATVATDSNYVCPEMTEEDVLEIRGGRHPVVDRMLGVGKFVSNDLDMKTRFCLITGPNMAGKSTYLRQNALIILLSHIGSFVPATEARIGICDKIFCRVGASDNLARGESTFLLEMQEAAFILRTCTRRSFVIVDEIGRGTSTQDGMAIAYAVMKDLLSKDVKTLFATHYHELTMMDTSGIRLLTLSVREEGGNIEFLRHVIDGVANSSYGIHVAKLAGIPSSVIRTAKNFQSRHFEDYSPTQTSLFTSDSGDEDVVSDISGYRKLIDEICLINPDEITPLQAMILVSRLKEEAMELKD